jgi:signal transduction histidine kinase
MAIVTEVVKKQVGTDPASIDRLSEIAETARGLVDSMSEIVWSIDPRHDDLRSVIVHLRQFASDVLEARGIKFDFNIAQDLESVKVAPEQRRHLFLILKEAINNISRHSNCNLASIAIHTRNNQLVAEIHDDGCGFDPSHDVTAQTDRRGGHGLENMRARARQLDGTLSLRSSPREGTRLTLNVPIRELRA